MSGPEWRTDFPIDVESVRAILDARFPELRDARVERLGEGWDFTAFLVNGEWVFRFPKREDEIVRLERDNALTAYLAPRLPLPIPVAEWNGEPGEDFPWPFAGYRYIAGVPGDRVEVPASARPGLARALGEFFTVLHSTPPEEVAFANLDTGWEPSPISRDGDLLAHLYELADLVSAGTVRDVRRIVEEVEPPPPGPGPRCVCHADLFAEHVILDPEGRRVAGLIDWSDASLCDPALEFVALYCWLGTGFGDEVLAHYSRPMDDGFRRRCVYRAVRVAIEDVWVGRKTAFNERPDLAISSLPAIVDAVLSAS